MGTALVDRPHVGVLLALTLTVVGGALRMWMLGAGYIADEMGWTVPGGIYWNWMHGEAAVNPPLMRMVLSAFFELGEIPYYGRLWSFLAGTLAIPLMFWLGRLVGGDRNVPGYLAAYCLVFLPTAIQQAALFRSYATLLCVLIWHLIALVQVVEAAPEPRRHWRWQFMASAALLPHIHYVSLVILFLEGLCFAAYLRNPNFIRNYLPAVVLFLPLAYRIVTGQGEHLEPQFGLTQNINQLAYANLPTSLFPYGSFLALLAWVRLHPRQKTLALATATCALGITLVAAYHDARIDLAIVPAAYAIPLVATLPLLLPSQGLWWPLVRQLAWVAIALEFYRALTWRYDLDILPPRRQDGVMALARDVHDDRWPRDRPTYLFPPDGVHPLHYYLAGRPMLEACPIDHAIICFVQRGRPFYGFEGRTVPRSYIVTFTPESRADTFAPQCRLAHEVPGYWVWDCPSGWTAP